MDKIKKLEYSDLESMEIGDVFDVYYGHIPQISIICTQNCGFKHYIVLGNGLIDKTFFEGNSKEDLHKCLSDLKDYIYNVNICGWLN